MCVSVLCFIESFQLLFSFYVFFSSLFILNKFSFCCWNFLYLWFLCIFTFSFFSSFLFLNVNSSNRVANGCTLILIIYGWTLTTLGLRIVRLLMLHMMAERTNFYPVFELDQVFLEFRAVSLLKPKLKKKCFNSSDTLICLLDWCDIVGHE